MASDDLLFGRYKVAGLAAKSANSGQREKVRAVLEAIQSQAEKIPDAVMPEVMRALKGAERELAADLAKWLKGEHGAERFTTNKLRALLLQVRASIEGIGRVQPKLLGGLVAGNTQAAIASNRLLVSEMSRLSAVFGNPAPQLNLPTIEHLVQRNNWLLERFPAKTKRYTEKAKAAIRNHMARGVAKGETIGEMSTRLMKLRKRPRGFYAAVANPDEVASGMAKGLFAGRYSDAERIVRTEVLNSYNAHHQRTVEESGMKKRWDASRDRHCSNCARMDGEVRGYDEEFEVGLAYPPMHPNCRCIITPWMDEWPEIKPLTQGASAPVVTRGGTAKESVKKLMKEKKISRREAQDDLLSSRYVAK